MNIPKHRRLSAGGRDASRPVTIDPPVKDKPARDTKRNPKASGESGAAARKETRK